MKQHKMTGNKAFQRNNAHWHRIEEQRLDNKRRKWLKECINSTNFPVWINN